MVEITEYDYAVKETMDLFIDDLLMNFNIYTNINQDEHLHEITKIKRFVDAFVDTGSPIESFMAFGLFMSVNSCARDFIFGDPIITKPTHNPLWVFEEDKIPDCFMNLSLKDTQTTETIRIKKQVNIGKYRVDFLIEHPKFNIIIECDGYQWHEKTQTQTIYEKERDRFLIANGYTVLHFMGKEIKDNIFGLSGDIADLVYTKLIEGDLL